MATVTGENIVLQLFTAEDEYYFNDSIIFQCDSPEINIRECAFTAGIWSLTEHAEWEKA